MTNLAASFRNLFREGIAIAFLWFGLEMVNGVQFRIPDTAAAPGESVETEVRVSEFEGVQALQFSLSWDPTGLEVGEVSGFGLPGLGPNSFGVFGAQGRLSVIWDSSTLEGQSLPEDAVLFRLSFQVLAADGATVGLAFGDTPTQRLVVQDLARGSFEASSGQVFVGLPPVITGATELSLSEDQASNPLTLSFSDDSTPVEELEIVFTSSNEELLPVDGVRLTGQGETRELVVTPRPDQFGVAELVVQARDAHGGTGSLTILITVIAINDPPTAEDDAVLLEEDSEPVLIEVLLNDSLLPDPGGTLEIESVEPGPQGGVTEIVAGGILYQPAANFNGVEEIGYQIRDEAGLMDSAIIRVTLTPVNDPPTAAEDLIEIEEDSAEVEVRVLENDSAFPDENESLSVVVVSPASRGGTVSLRDGRVFYTPRPDFFGVDTFQYTLGDGNGGFSEGVVTVAVASVNDPPVAVDDGLSVPEDSADVFIDVLVNDSVGPDLGEALSIASVEPPSSGGQVRIEEGLLVYSAPPNFFGIERFEYAITDGNGGTASASVSVTVVNDRADAPVARDDRFNVAEDSGPTLLEVLKDNGNGRDFDPDGDALVVVSVQLLDDSPGRVEVSASGLGVLYTPAENFVGGETFSYVISDGERTASGFGFVTVSDSDNDPPIAFLDEFIVEEDSGANRLDVLADNGNGADRDPEGNELSVILVPGVSPLGGSLTLSEDAKAILYTPRPNFSGIDEFPYFVTDGASEARGLVRVEVVNQDNDPPIVRSDLIDVLEDLPNQILDVLADNGEGPDVDPEGEALRITTVGGIDEDPVGSVEIGSDERRLFYSPPANFIGEVRFTYSVSDGLHERSGEVTLQVANVDDDPPVALEDAFFVDEGAVGVALLVLGNSSQGFDFDPEGEAVSVVSVPAFGSQGGSLELGSFGRIVFYTPAANFIGEESFDYVISDGGLEGVGKVTVSVRNTDDDPPVARDDRFEVPEDSLAFPLLVLADNGAGEDFDPEGASLHLSGVESVDGAEGRVILAEDGRALLYTPVPNFIGQESFQYTVSDGQLSSKANVWVEVVNVDDDPPIARDDQFLALEDEGVIELRVLEDNGAGPDFDPDGDELVVVEIPANTVGSASIELSEDKKVILYQSAEDFFGSDRFRYSISDGTHHVEANVSVLVTRGDNDAPVARADRFTVTEDSGDNLFDLLADNGNGPDLDPDEDVLRLLAVHGPGSQGGAVSRDPDTGQAIYRPAPDFEGEETFSYTISDGILTSTGEVTVIVTPIPDPPTIERILPIVEDQGTERIEVRLSVDDVDSPPDEIRLQASSDNESLFPTDRVTVTREAQGWLLTLLPLGQESGTATLFVEATDGDSTTRESVSITIEEIVRIAGRTAGVFLGSGEVFVDRDGDGLRSNGEPVGELGRDSRFEIRARLSELDSNRNGKLDEADGHLVVTSGVDLLSGAAVSYELRTPLGASVISPFSTLVSAVLEVGQVQSLDEAVERARQLARFEGSELVGAPWLSLDPLSLAEEDPELAIVLFHRNASLDAVVNLAKRLFPMGDGIPSTRRIFHALANLERAVIGDCEALAELIEQLEQGSTMGLSSEVKAFSVAALCQHLNRIDRSSELESLSAVSAALGQMRLFAEVDLWYDVESARLENQVSDTLTFQALSGQVEARIADFPQTNILGSLDSEGSLRFLRPQAAWFENGDLVERAIVVRQGGSQGPLNAAVVLQTETAEAGIDFRTAPLLISFVDGQLASELDLSEFLIDDNLDEPDEAVSMRLFFGDETDDQGNAVVRDSAQLWLRDDEGIGLFEFASPPFDGEEDAAKKVVFVERRGGISGAATVIVQLLEESGQGSAEAGVDYERGELRMGFSDGERLKGLVLPIIPDFQVEPDEGLLLDLRTIGAAGLGAQTRARYTIVNDDFDQVPTIEAIPDLLIEEDLEARVVFRVSDDVTPIEDLEVEAFSKSLSLVLVKNLELNPDRTSYSLELETVPNANGLGRIVIRVSDGRQMVEQEFGVLVTPVNDAPKLRIGGERATAFIEDEAPVAIASMIQVEDADGGELDGARVSFSIGFNSVQDRLIFGRGGGAISGHYDRVTGVLELSGRASIADYQTALRSVLYDNRSDNPSTRSRALSISVRDADVESEAVEVVMVVQAVNDQPILLRVESDPLVYLENADPTVISKSVLVATVDDQFFTEARVRIGEGYIAAEDRLTVGELAEGLVAAAFDQQEGQIVISGRASLLDYQNALRAVRYFNLSDAPQPEFRRIEFLIRDGELWSDPKHRDLRVAPVNDLPVVQGLVDGVLVSGREKTLQFTVTDPDSEIPLPLVSVGSTNPSLIPSSSIRLIRDGAGYSLSFAARAGQVGEAAFTVSVGVGKNLVQETFRIVVAQESFAPRILGPEEISLAEDAEVELSLKIEDPDDVSLGLAVKFAVDNRVLFPPGSIVVTRNLFDLQVKLTPAVNAFGNALLTFTVSDSNASSEHRIEIKVVSVNDLPVVNGIRNFVVDPGSDLDVALQLSDIESPIDELLLGVRPLDPRLNDRLSFEIAGRGDRRNLRLSFDPSLRGTVSFRLVVVDSDGGASSYPFEVRIRESELRPETLQVTNLGNGQVELRWEGGGRLAISGRVSGPYLPLSGSTSPVRLRIQEGQEFFRIVD